MRYIFKMIVVALLVPCALVRSQTTKPTTAPAVSPEAQSLLDDLLQAYASVKSLDLAGTISLQFQAENESQNPSAAFAGAYRAPGQFRNEIKNDALVVSTGAAFAISRLKVRGGRTVMRRSTSCGPKT